SNNPICTPGVQSRTPDSPRPVDITEAKAPRSTGENQTRNGKGKYVDYLQVDGTTLEYRWIGPSPDDAPTLVFLHEGLGCTALWKDLPGRGADATGWGVLVCSRA